MDYLDRKKRMAVVGPLWWLLDGMSSSDVLAAYQFAKRNTAAEALRNLVKPGTYDLSNNGCMWSSSNGYTISENGGQYLDNASLRSAGIKSVVIKIANGSLSRAMPLTGGWGNIGIWLNLPVCFASFAYENIGKIGLSHGNGLSVLYQEDYAHGSIAMDQTKMGSSIYTDGVFGFTVSGETLYCNGASVSLSVATSTRYSYNGDHRWTGFIAADIPRLIGGRAAGSSTGRWDSEGNLSVGGSFNVLAMACYNKYLSASEHQSIYKKMLAV